MIFYIKFVSCGSQFVLVSRLNCEIVFHEIIFGWKCGKAFLKNFLAETANLIFGETGLQLPSACWDTCFAGFVSFRYCFLLEIDAVIFFFFNFLHARINGWQSCSISLLTSQSFRNSNSQVAYRAFFWFSVQYNEPMNSQYCFFFRFFFFSAFLGGCWVIYRCSSLLLQLGNSYRYTVRMKSC